MLTFLKYLVCIVVSLFAGAGLLLFVLIYRPDLPDELFPASILDLQNDEKQIMELRDQNKFLLIQNQRLEQELIQSGDQLMELQRINRMTKHSLDRLQEQLESRDTE